MTLGFEYVGALPFMLTLTYPLPPRGTEPCELETRLRLRPWPYAGGVLGVERAGGRPSTRRAWLKRLQC